MIASTSMSRTNRAISVAALMTIAVAAVIPSVQAQDTAPPQSPAQLVDSLHSAFGDHHSRAVHAKGTLLEGHFTPSPQARTLTMAGVFSAGAVPVTVRFSDFTGIPEIPDNINDANPRGLAIKLRPATGAGMDVVTHSFNGFPVATGDQFGELMHAIGDSGPDAKKPTALDAFLASHPIAKTFLTTQKPPPVSYATLSYFGVNSFKFTDAAGKSKFVRYRFVPVAGIHVLSDAELKTKGPDYLQQEIRSRVKAGPIAFDWYAQIAAPGDVIDDPSVAWSESRKQIKLGTFSIDQVVADQKEADHSTLFLPGNVPDGIAPADPMIAIRHAAYPISFGHRQ